MRELKLMALPGIPEVNRGVSLCELLMPAVALAGLALQAGDVLDGAALDKYSFVRDAYLQRQRNRVYDGNPPEEEPSDPPK